LLHLSLFFHAAELAIYRIVVDLFDSLRFSGAARSDLDPFLLFFVSAWKLLKDYAAVGGFAFVSAAPTG